MKYCKCSKVYGMYTDDKLNAIISEDAIPIGFQNSSLKFAIDHRPETGNGKRFEAFVIPRKCPTIKIIEEE
jgi:hypothetical protein